MFVVRQMKQQQSVLEFQLTPFNVLLRAVLSQLQEKDKYSIFAQPVSTREVCVGCLSHTHTHARTRVWSCQITSTDAQRVSWNMDD